MKYKNKNPEKILKKKQVFKKHLYTNVQSSSSHNIKRWKQCRYPTDKWINKMSYLHTIEYYSAPPKKENEVQIHAKI